MSAASVPTASSAFAGDSPPKYAAWWMANFAPWDCDAPPVMPYGAWQAYRKNLQQRATRYSLQESGDEKADRHAAGDRERERGPYGPRADGTDAECAAHAQPRPLEQEKPGA